MSELQVLKNPTEDRQFYREDIPLTAVPRFGEETFSEDVTGLLQYLTWNAELGATATGPIFLNFVPPATIASNDDAVANDPSPRDKLHATLQSYLQLDPGWDGYEGIPPKRQAVIDAISFLDRKPADIQAPYPQLSSDGEVGLYWKTATVFADIGFYGDGEYSYYGRCVLAPGVSIEAGEDHCSVGTDRWPPQLLEILNKASID